MPRNSEQPDRRDVADTAGIATGTMTVAHSRLSVSFWHYGNCVGGCPEKSIGPDAIRGHIGPISHPVKQSRNQDLRFCNFCRSAFYRSHREDGRHKNAAGFCSLPCYRLWKKVAPSTCTRCKKVLPASSFPSDRRARRGHGPWCYDCYRNSVRRGAGKYTPKPKDVKYYARRAVVAAVRYGRIIKPACCQDCGTPKHPQRLHGHHEDYTKALDVVWLCAKCHGVRHRTPFFSRVSSPNLTPQPAPTSPATPAAGRGE
jgi:hypothetical protein